MNFTFVRSAESHSKPPVSLFISAITAREPFGVKTRRERAAIVYTMLSQ